jgi:hypothetical protein
VLQQQQQQQQQTQGIDNGYHSRKLAMAFSVFGIDCQCR